MTTETVQSLPATGVWTIDPIHSTVRFSIRHHAVATFRGSLSPITGAYDGAAGRLAGEVRTDALVLPGADRLKDHLQTDAFFDASAHPTFSFAAARLSVDDDGRLEVAGDLTIRGVSNPVTAVGSVRGPASVRHHDGRVTERIGIDLSATIDRRDYGIEFNNEIAEGVLNLGWDVAIDAALELVLDADG